jgi:hypothetical protein
MMITLQASVSVIASAKAMEATSIISPFGSLHVWSALSSLEQLVLPCIRSTFSSPYLFRSSNQVISCTDGLYKPISILADTSFGSTGCPFWITSSSAAWLHLWLGTVLTLMVLHSRSIALNLGFPKVRTSRF